jgi:peptide/nickel transport system permease protein
MTMTKTSLLGKQKASLREFWVEYKRSRMAVACLVILGFFIVISLGAPVLATYAARRTAVVPALQPPSIRFPLGTDRLGRDVLSETIWGIQTSMIVGLVTASAALAIGVLVGSFAGYYGGALDDILSRVTETTFVLPALIVALVVVSVYGATFTNILMVLSLLSWPTTARIARAECVHLRGIEFVESSRALGAGNVRIILRHIIPNAIAAPAVNCIIVAAASILAEASLGFLGLTDPNVTSLGKVLGESIVTLHEAWWLSVFPGILLVALILSLTVAGERINIVLNPKLRVSG